MGTKSSFIIFCSSSDAGGGVAPSLLGATSFVSLFEIDPGAGEDDATISDAVEDATISDVVEDATISDTVEDATISDAVEDATISDTVEDAAIADAGVEYSFQ